MPPCKLGQLFMLTDRQLVGRKPVPALAGWNAILCIAANKASMSHSLDVCVPGTHLRAFRTDSSKTWTGAAPVTPKNF
jgi:hypothetical protein